MHLQATMQTILSLHKEANKGSLEFCDSSSENSKYCDHSSQWRLEWSRWEVNFKTAEHFQDQGFESVDLLLSRPRP